MYALSALRSLAVTITLAAMACSTGAPAKLAELDQPISLEPDQGILVVEVDASEQVGRLEIASVDVGNAPIILANLQSGRHIHLLPVRAGRYRWNKVELKGHLVVNRREIPATWIMDRDEPHWGFHVRPGVVSYPGRLVLDRVTHNRMRMYTLNRSAQLLESIRARGSGLLDQYAISYSGRGRDDFLEFYASVLTKQRGQQPRAGARPDDSK